MAWHDLNARLRGCTIGRLMKEQGGLGERVRICIVRGKLWRKQLKKEDGYLQHSLT